MQVKKKKTPYFPEHVCFYSKRNVLNRFIFFQFLYNRQKLITHWCKSIIFAPITKRTLLLLNFACIYRKNEKSILVCIFSSFSWEYLWFIISYSRKTKFWDAVGPWHENHCRICKIIYKMNQCQLDNWT